MFKALKNYFKVRILLFGITLVLWNCEKEEVNQMSLQLTEIQQIENEFSLKNFNDSFVSKNLVVHWDDFNSKENIKENTVIYEFNTSLKVKNTIENEKQRFDFKYKVLGFKDDSDRWYFELIKIFTNNDKALDGISYFSPTDFSGTIYHYNLKGESLALKAYKDGSFLNAFSGKGSKKNNLQSKFPSDDGGSQGGGFWMFSRTKHYTDWYRGNSSGGWSYTHSTYNGSTTEYVWVNTGYTGSGNYHNHGPHGGVEDPTDNHPVEVIIKLSGKAKCIYDKLEASNSNLFKETIGKFIGDPKYNLVFENGECSKTDDACTNIDNLDSTGEIIIKIEDNNANPLQMAQYILHEAIHAELFRFVSRYESGIDPNNRARLFQLFKYYSELYGVGDIQHIYMAERYINPIASALRKLDGNKYPNDYYKAFAWDGLRVWDADNLLNIEIDSKYEEYRKIVIENTTISCD